MIHRLYSQYQNSKRRDLEHPNSESKGLGLGYISAFNWRKLVLASAVLPTLLSCYTAQAQTNTGNPKASRIIPIIAALLLEEEPLIRPEGNSIKLSLGEISSFTLLASQNDPVFLEFDNQRQGVEVCFDLTSNQAIEPSQLIVEVNGQRSSAVIAKDNCYVINVGAQRSENFISIRVENSNATIRLDRIELSQANPIDELGLPTSTRGSWDDRAVRKVLKIFAYGGHPSDQQITLWADMPPKQAIDEMLNFEQHNTKLSSLTPADQALGFDEISNAPDSGSLAGYIDYIANDASTLPLSQRDRDFFLLSERRLGFTEVYQRYLVTRGLNPFRQRIGFWETNYHLAVNLDAGVTSAQMMRYHDDIMAAHEQGRPYYEVIGVAAKSAAVAMQYGHRFNDWVESEQKCECNDDFAREIHQLFYGIFGLADPEEHENVTIKQTARLLTGMPVNRRSNIFDTFVSFDTPEIGGRTRQHHEDPVQVLGQTITGRTAAEKIDALMPVSMQHPESLSNLPIKIVEVLADNNLSDSDRQQLRAAWATLGVERKLLDYLRAYATSRIFHDRSQLKYFTSFDRVFYTANKFNVSQVEALYSGRGNLELRGVGREIRQTLRDDRAGDVFEPLNNVFGGQAAVAASDSTLAFEGNFNRSAEDRNIDYRIRWDVRCGGCNNGNEWIKDWSQIIPPEENGEYSALHVARWMWRHFVGSMDNYGVLENAHLVAIIGANAEEETVEDLGSFNVNGNGRNRFWDLNYLLCIRADLLEPSNPRADPAPANSLSDLMDNSAWPSRCQVNRVDPYSEAERSALNLVVTPELIRDTPYIANLVNELENSAVPLRVKAGDPAPDGGTLSEVDARFIRYRANERVQAAAVFMMATPFVFGEGQR